ncbi:MAG: hypothetical protein PHE67_04610 [Campylobacterales bacterium]|nr:hypothetical protein [Campylobacterales bacterium]
MKRIALAQIKGGAQKTTIAAVILNALHRNKIPFNFEDLDRSGVLSIYMTKSGLAGAVSSKPKVVIVDTPSNFELGIQSFDMVLIPLENEYHTARLALDTQAIFKKAGIPTYFVFSRVEYQKGLQYDEVWKSLADELGAPNIAPFYISDTKTYRKIINKNIQLTDAILDKAPLLKADFEKILNEFKA